METIKIEVSLNVNLSADTKNFFKTLFLTPRCEITPCNAPTPIAPAAPTTEGNATTKSSETEAPGEPAPTPIAPAVPATSNASNISIEEVRAALSKKVNEHRPAIKDKLTELGAPSITKMDPSKYGEMLDFLNSL